MKSSIANIAQVGSHLKQKVTQGAQKVAQGAQGVINAIKKNQGSKSLSTNQARSDAEKNEIRNVIKTEVQNVFITQKILDAERSSLETKIVALADQLEQHEKQKTEMPEQEIYALIDAMTDYWKQVITIKGKITTSLSSLDQFHLTPEEHAEFRREYLEGYKAAASNHMQDQLSDLGLTQVNVRAYVTKSLAQVEQATKNAVMQTPNTSAPSKATQEVAGAKTHMDLAALDRHITKQYTPDTEKVAQYKHSAQKAFEELVNTTLSTEDRDTYIRALDALVRDEFTKCQKVLKDNNAFIDTNTKIDYLSAVIAKYRDAAFTLVSEAHNAFEARFTKEPSGQNLKAYEEEKKKFSHLSDDFKKEIEQIHKNWLSSLLVSYKADAEPQLQTQTQMQKKDPPPTKPKSKAEVKSEQVSTDSSDGFKRIDESHVSKSSGPLSLDLVNLEHYIDLFAEQKALQEFDDEMKSHDTKGFFIRHFKRAIHRIGRGGDIEVRKKRIKQELMIGLADGALEQNEVISFVQGNKEAIITGSFLEEEKQKLTPLDEIAKDIIQNQIITPGLNPEERKRGLQTLRSILQSKHSQLSIDLGQLDWAIAQIESKLETEIDLASLEIGLNLYDAGRIGNQKGGHTFADKSRGGKMTQLMDGIDKKWIGGIITNPTFAAIVSGLGIQWILGRSLATFGGGLIGGSLVGGTLAGVRATRESRDSLQTALHAHAINDSHQINPIHQKAFDKILQTINGRNVEEFLSAFRSPDISMEVKRQLALEYYARRSVSSTTGYNFLLYPADASAEINAAILKDLRILGLTSGWSREPEQQKDMTRLQTTYTQQARKALEIDLDHRKSYSLNQGVINGASAFAVGSILGGLQWGLSSWLNGEDTINATTTTAATTAQTTPAPYAVVTPVSTGSTGHQIFSDPIHRTWLTNGTTTIDGNELRLGKDYSIAKMLSHSSSLRGVTDHINLSDGSTYGLITTGGETYKVAIDPSGKLQFDPFMKAIIDGKQFKTLEIVHNTGHGHNVFASIRGVHSGVGDTYVPSAAVIPPVIDDVVTTLPPVTEDPKVVPPFVPFAIVGGANAYHEGSDKDGKRPRDIGSIPPPLKPLTPKKEEKSDDHHDHDASDDNTEAIPSSPPSKPDPSTMAPPPVKSEDTPKVDLPAGTFSGSDTTGGEPIKLTPPGGAWLPGIPTTPLLTHVPSDMKKPDTISTPSSSVSPSSALTDLKKSASDYWDEIVKLRQILEGRKEGKKHLFKDSDGKDVDLALGDSDIANMQATLKIMEGHYVKKQQEIRELEAQEKAAQEALSESTSKDKKKAKIDYKAMSREEAQDALKKLEAKKVKLSAITGKKKKKAKLEKRIADLQAILTTPEVVTSVANTSDAQDKAKTESKDTKEPLRITHTPNVTS